VQAIQQVIALTLRDAFNALITDLTEDINRIVPKATGKLRADLMETLGGSSVTDYTLNIMLGSDIEYAKYTNQMPETWLRHYGEYRYTKNVFQGVGGYKYGGQKRVGVHHVKVMPKHPTPGIIYTTAPLMVVHQPVELNDPDAQHNWMQFLILHAKKWLKDYLRDFLKQHAASAGLRITVPTTGLAPEVL